MPVARIYASLVEEAEPICADLLARGYNVEVVFPDAILCNPADLELRVERCSAEQAIARVEAGGSPSRCVFVTPGKGPRRELLLVEMTVLSTGTDGRHPMALPGMAVAADHLTGAPVGSVEVHKASPSLAEVLPFPVLPADSAAADVIAVEKTAAPSVADVVKMEHPSRRRVSDQNRSKDLIAELNVFLAHAPVVARPEGVYLRILEHVRRAVGVKRALKNWESLTLSGVAASLVILVISAWYAGPNRARHLGTVAPRPVVRVAPRQSPPSMSSVDLANVKPVPFTTRAPSVPLRRASERRRLVSRSHRRQPQIQAELVAQDQVVRVAPQVATKLPSNKIFKPVQPTTTSELIQPAPLRSAPRRAAPVKIITDLK